VTPSVAASTTLNVPGLHPLQFVAPAIFADTHGKHAMPRPENGLKVDGSHATQSAAASWKRASPVWSFRFLPFGQSTHDGFPPATRAAYVPGEHALHDA
jgi:hypothetical protein